MRRTVRFDSIRFDSIRFDELVRKQEFRRKIWFPSPYVYMIIVTRTSLTHVTFWSDDRELSLASRSKYWWTATSAVGGDVDDAAAESRNVVIVMAMPNDGCEAPFVVWILQEVRMLR
jgi:hypothetical protein